MLFSKEKVYYFVKHLKLGEKNFKKPKVEETWKEISQRLIVI